MYGFAFDFTLENLEKATIKNMMQIGFHHSIFIRKMRVFLFKQFNEQKIKHAELVSRTTKIKHMNFAFVEKLLAFFSANIDKMTPGDFIYLFKSLQISKFKNRKFNSLIEELVDSFIKILESQKNEEKESQLIKQLLFDEISQMKFEKTFLKYDKKNTSGKIKCSRISEKRTKSNIDLKTIFLSLKKK